MVVAVSVPRGGVLIAVVVRDKVEVMIWVLVPPGSVVVKINPVVAVAVSVAFGRVSVKDKLLASRVVVIEIVEAA